MIVANSAIVLRLEGFETREDIERIATLYRNTRVERYFIHVHPEAQLRVIRSCLEESGLGKARGWMKLTCARAALPEIRETNTIIHCATPLDALTFGQFVADSFDLGPELAE